ncbi:hypothetical protein B0H16DRAFT_1544656 [Mycena metata]|uniref:DUF6535 domain-containing protein n=1 Tax=Mycena metata TaxID=1033252 RepID=A0AAD7NBC3_9AGAR|nr:hypothetical protein B0H16DRAFT_1544656 [Mycena metata]
MAELSPIPPEDTPAVDSADNGSTEESELPTAAQAESPLPFQAAPSNGEEQLQRIVGAIEEQSACLKTVLESLTQTIEAGHPQIQSTDKKIAFWTAYKGLADEFDKEFQAKYGSDLDSALIFAGLFPAVSSAFIIQIQPQLQPDPNAATQALLAVLVGNITGITVSAPPPSGPSNSIVVVQSFLYFSLSSTLLAALLAVLGKQWLLHYDSAGTKGSIEQRGIERQKKIDGIQRWKFGIVMQICPLLIQFSLLLFAVALSIYLWTIHLVLAGIALALTLLGCMLYSVMITLALIFPDSPFQTPFTGLLKVFLSSILFQGPLWEFRLWVQRRIMNTAFGELYTTVSQIFLGLNRHISLLPIFSNSGSDRGTSTPGPMFSPPPPLSPEAVAIIWTLGTSTDPMVVEAAAALVPEFQWWSPPFDVEPVFTRLNDVYRSCFDYDGGIPTRSLDRATNCIRALGIFDAACHTYVYFWGAPEPLRSMICSVLAVRYNEPRFLTDRHVVLTPWCLRLIAHGLPFEGINLLRGSPKSANVTVSVQNQADFAEFLFCLNSFFTPPHAQDCSLPDKSNFTTLLTTRLFEHLSQLVTGSRPVDEALATDLLLHTAQLAKKIRVYANKMDSQCVNAALRLCSTSHLSSQAKLAALRLLRVSFSWQLSSESTNIVEVSWIHSLLGEADHSEDAVHDLVQVLWCCRPNFGKVTPASLQKILGTLITSEGGDMASSILCSSENWFTDPDLGPILEAQSTQIWSVLAEGLDCVILGTKLLHLPKWKLVISQNLPAFLDLYDDYEFFLDQHYEQAVRLLLSTVWEVDDEQMEKFGAEKANAIAFSLLAKQWDGVTHPDFLDTVRHKQNLKLLQCTVRVMFYTRLDRWYDNLLQPSQSFKDTMMLPLGEALRAAGARVKADMESEATINQTQMDALDLVADILLKLGSFTEGELRNGTKLAKLEREHWIGLRDSFLVDIKKLEKMWKEEREEEE